jgi:hypothetical protein
MGRIVITQDLAHAAGMDAGNRSMRRAGRTAWNEEDYNAAAAEEHRLLPCPAPYAQKCSFCRITSSV